MARRSRLVYLCLGLSAFAVFSQFAQVFVPESYVTLFSRRTLGQESASKYQKQDTSLETRALTNERHIQEREAARKQEEKSKLIDPEALSKRAIQGGDSSTKGSQQTEIAPTNETKKIVDNQALSKRAIDNLESAISSTKKKAKLINTAALSKRAMKDLESAQTEESHHKQKLEKKKNLRKRPVEHGDGSNEKKSSVVFNSDTLAVARKNSTEDCETPREPIWEWHYYGKGKTQASKRLLVALYSGFGTYSKLLELTGRSNKAYARKWKHDLVLVQGAAVRLPSDGDCEPPAYRATFNKIPLLQLALEQKEKYDHLLILDTDAMVYDMKTDVTTLLPQGHMLAAQKVKPTDSRHTWDINAGVTLWDLHHPRIEEAARKWDESSKKGMTTGWHASNDQFHLHYTLKTGNYTNDIHAMSEEFNYGHGTIIKHFIRKKQQKWGDSNILDNRKDRIADAVDEVCDQHKPICEGIENKVYVD